MSSRIETRRKSARETIRRLFRVARWPLNYAPRVELRIREWASRDLRRKEDAERYAEKWIQTQERKLNAIHDPRPDEISHIGLRDVSDRENQSPERIAGLRGMGIHPSKLRECDDGGCSSSD